MNLLLRPLSEITFQDVAQFCQKGYPEGVQLDYKRDFPNRLAKQFAAFSNTRGGLIIIGVEEDAEKGTPTHWDGIEDTGKVLERVHQAATLVQPVPRYETEKTNETAGKVFVLLRIFEGDRPPYYVLNDARIWVRTGSVSNPIDDASPDVVQLLIGKKDQAKLARENAQRFAADVLEAAMMRAEHERLGLIAKERQEWERTHPGHRGPDNFAPTYCRVPLSADLPFMRAILQPYLPSSALVSVQELIGMNRDIHASSDHYRDIPPQPVPNGTLQFDWDHYTGRVLCQQVYATGAVHRIADVLYVDESGKRQLSLPQVAGHLAHLFTLTDNLLKRAGYQGGVMGELVISDIQGAEAIPIRPPSPFSFSHQELQCLMRTYRWQFSLDTSTLGNTDAARDFFLERLREIYWSLGFPSLSESVVLDFLKSNRMFMA